jgi:hypothetical protein
LDNHAFSLQSAQLTRTRNYDDSLVINIRHPRNAPEWAFVAQDLPVDTDFSAPATPIQQLADVEDAEGAEEE